MTTLRLILELVKYQNKAFWRNPAAAFFTFIFPLMFLVIFNLLFGNRDMNLPGGTVKTATFYVPGIAAMGLISACYTNVAISVSFSRDQGRLKRIRGTPLPPLAYLTARVLHATFIALLLVVIVTIAGRVAYGVEVPTNTMPAFIVTLAVGSAAFSALGLAMTPFIPNADASPAVVNGSILPLLFISDVFIPMQDAPPWLVTFSNIFPVKHLSAALMKAFNP
ncbi:MAG: putative multidrug transporter permease protein, partial [Dehalococcoidia bacterium]|nr:putative multidrug transporter permease protein [Dehalococcoidia bacterium]